MKIHEYNEMMKYLTRPGKVLGNNINNRVPHKKGGSENSKMLQYINDNNIVHGDMKATKEEKEAAAKRIEARPKEMSYQDEYKLLYGKEPKKVAKKIPVIPPKPDMVNGHSDWNTEDWLESIDPGGWQDDRKVEIDKGLFETYLELLKAGELLPGTTFQMFEKNYGDFDTDAISKIKKRVEDKKKIEGIASILSLSPGKRI